MKCWNCSAPLDLPVFGKLSFRAECEKCSAPLHCCFNCKYYKPGAPNDCRVPGTEYVADRKANNYCEEFALQVPSAAPKKESDRKKFDDLFT